MDNIKLITFIMVLGLVSPIFSFGFTAFSSTTPTHYDLAFSKESLILAGIDLGEVEANNVTYNGGWVEYNTLNNTARRIRWDDYVDIGGITYGPGVFIIQKRGIVGQALQSWNIFGIFSAGVTINWINPDTGEVSPFLFNNTVVNYWREDYNWTRFQTEAGEHVFFTPIPGSNNITQSIYNYGNVTVTIGLTLNTNDSINFKTFIGWYTTSILGDNVYGLPVFLYWLNRVLTALGFLAMIVLIKGLTQL